MEFGHNSTMADWLGELWWWLCCRVRRPKIYAIVTTLFLITVAVQRRENGVDRHRLSADDHRQRHTVSQHTHTFGDLESADQQNPVIGVFLLISVDDIEDHQWNQTLDETHIWVDTELFLFFFVFRLAGFLKVLQLNRMKHNKIGWTEHKALKIESANSFGTCNFPHVWISN